MADETLDALWHLKGGPELAAAHALLEGARVPRDELREALGLSHEEADAALTAAAAAGLAEADDGAVTFVPWPAGSPQRARLDAFLEPRREAWTSLLPRLSSRLLVRFLGRPPRGA